MQTATEPTFDDVLALVIEYINSLPTDNAQIGACARLTHHIDIIKNDIFINRGNQCPE